MTDHTPAPTTCRAMQVQEAFRAALQLAADEAAKSEPPEPIPAPTEVAQLVEEAMFGFYGVSIPTVSSAMPSLRAAHSWLVRPACRHHSGPAERLSSAVKLLPIMACTSTLMRSCQTIMPASRALTGDLSRLWLHCRRGEQRLQEQVPDASVQPEGLAQSGATGARAHGRHSSRQARPHDLRAARLQGGYRAGCMMKQMFVLFCLVALPVHHARG